MQYSADELKGAGTRNKTMLEAESNYTFFIYRPKNQSGRSLSLSGSGYFTFETARNANGFYGGITPFVGGADLNPPVANSSNTASFGVKSLVRSDYKFSYDLFRETASAEMPATSSFIFKPITTVPIGSVFYRATGDYDMIISPETVECGEPISYTQGNFPSVYPSLIQTVVGSGNIGDTITATFNFGGFVPDRATVEHNGTQVIDTGYCSPETGTGPTAVNSRALGGVARGLFTSSLFEKAIPELPGEFYPQFVGVGGGTSPNVIEIDGYPRINSETLTFTRTFTKAASAIVDVQVYGPEFTSTAWTVTISCPA